MSWENEGRMLRLFDVTRTSKILDVVGNRNWGSELVACVLRFQRRRSHHTPSSVSEIDKARASKIKLEKMPDFDAIRKLCSSALNFNDFAGTRSNGAGREENVDSDDMRRGRRQKKLGGEIVMCSR